MKSFDPTETRLWSKPPAGLDGDLSYAPTFLENPAPGEAVGAVLTLGEITRFFRAKKVIQVCPACGTSLWGVTFPDNEADLVQAIPYAKYRNTEQEMADLHSSGSPVITTDCKNCGYIRIFLRETIRVWLAENPAASSDPSDERDDATS